MRGLSLVLQSAAVHGRWWLVAGLVLGLSLPNLSVAVKPHVDEMIVFLTFTAALRLGPKAVLGVAGDLWRTARYLAVFQFAMPLTAALCFVLLGWVGPLPTALIILLAATPVSGSANLALMMGCDPAPCLRQLVLAMALLPVTVIPIFLLMPGLGEPGLVASASVRLLMLIVIATGIGFAIRVFWWREIETPRSRQIDGVSAIIMAVAVIGLVAAVVPALLNEPTRFAVWMFAAFAANIGLQVAGSLIAIVQGEARIAPSIGIVAGNRNVGLFLVALPASVTDPIFLFIGCYQFPMYLTPLMMAGYYRRLSDRL